MRISNIKCKFTKDFGKSILVGRDFLFFPWMHVYFLRYFITFQVADMPEQGDV